MFAGNLQGLSLWGSSKCRSDWGGLQWSPNSDLCVKRVQVEQRAGRCVECTSSRYAPICRRTHKRSAQITKRMLSPGCAVTVAWWCIRWESSCACPGAADGNHEQCKAATEKWRGKQHPSAPVFHRCVLCVGNLVVTNVPSVFPCVPSPYPRSAVSAFRISGKRRSSVREILQLLCWSGKLPSQPTVTGIRHVLYWDQKKSHVC